MTARKRRTPSIVARALQAMRHVFLGAPVTPPDLQALVRRHGSFSRVPPSAWQHFDRELKKWKRRR
jgi:hypothetical protein